ncbi:MAG: hypothetical protein DRP11_03995 [Candidatus Aenigmatarchaeota archaeon]|nr:MAG: hypothetical protein DRP11_03995 [Candidatus Aenigmarchaeota archaeon]
MIYPMMFNLPFYSLKRIRGSMKPLIEAMILNFVYAPLFYVVLTSVFIPIRIIKEQLKNSCISKKCQETLSYSFFILEKSSLARGWDMLRSAVMKNSSRSRLCSLLYSSAWSTISTLSRS